jgi:hypothetical protein
MRRAPSFFGGAPASYGASRKCLMAGCRKRVPYEQWFCQDHRLTGPTLAKQRLEEFAERVQLLRAAEAGGLTYVYAVGHDNMVKFGRTSNLRGRMATLQAHSPVPLELLTATFTHITTEKRIHDYLAADRAHGEWFRRSERAERVMALMDLEDDEPLIELLNSQA